MQPSIGAQPVVQIVIDHRDLWPECHYSSDMSVKCSRLPTSGDNAYKYLLQFYSPSGALQSELIVKQYHEVDFSEPYRERVPGTAVRL